MNHESSHISYCSNNLFLILAVQRTPASIQDDEIDILSHSISSTMNRITARIRSISTNQYFTSQIHSIILRLDSFFTSSLVSFDID